MIIVKSQRQCQLIAEAHDFQHIFSYVRTNCLVCIPDLFESLVISRGTEYLFYKIVIDLFPTEFSAETGIFLFQKALFSMMRF